MSSEAAVALYDVGKSLIFAKRRVGKAVNGDPTSLAVAAAQVTKAVKSASNWNNSIGNAAKTCVNALETASKAKTITGYAAKTLNFASGCINPLIATTGVIKVACAKDKKTEAINQGAALGVMFAAEGMAKKFLTEEGRKVLKKSCFYKNSKIIQGLHKFMGNIDKYAAAANSSNWGKIGIPLLKAAAFACISILGYSIGSKIADKINNARKGKNNIKEQNNPYVGEQTQIAENKAKNKTENKAENKADNRTGNKTKNKESETNQLDYVS